MHATILRNGESSAVILPEGRMVPIVSYLMDNQALLAVLSRAFPKVNFEILDVSPGSPSRLPTGEISPPLLFGEALC